MKILKKENSIVLLIGLICVLIVFFSINYAYSFFSVEKTNNSVITGEVESMKLSVNVTKVAPTDSSKLIPQLDEYITYAVIGRNGNCIDDNGNTVCHVYKVTLKNEGSSSMLVSGTLSLNNINNPNLKWARISGLTNPSVIGVKKSASATTFVTNEEYDVGETKEYYIVVWISESGLMQVDTGSYTGTVFFSSDSDMNLSTLTNFVLETSPDVSADTDTFLSTPILRNQIESIEFINTSDAPSNSINVYDVSAADDNSVLLYYTNDDNDDYYEVKIGTSQGITLSDSGNDLFSYLTNLTSIDLTKLDTSRMTTMKKMFFNCGLLVTLNVSDFDTSNVTDMSGMFGFGSSVSSSLTNIYGLENFDTSSVTTMAAMFQNCAKLNTINVSNFDTSNVTNMNWMFGAGDGVTMSLTNIYGLENFDTSNVTTMNRMFRSCSNLTSIDVSNFDTSNVTDMSGMFLYCNKLAALDVSNFDTTNVIAMNAMFYDCNSLTSLDVTNFDTTNVLAMNGMFYGCIGLTTLDLSNFNTLNVTNMNYMFRFCRLLTTIYVSDNFVTTNVTESTQMFEDCRSLVGGNGTVYNESYMDKTYARIDTADNPGYFTSNSAND